jgi:hypothetical protein
MDKWFVKVETTELARLQGDMRDLGTLLTTQQGERYSETATPHQPLVRFDDGDVFMSEA